MSATLWISAASTLLMGAVALGGPLAPKARAQAELDPEENPHGSIELCHDCHEPVAPGTPIESIVFSQGDASQTCSYCHDNAPHEVGLDPHGEEGEEQAELPEGWPVLEGELACLSCHDEPACDRQPLADDNRRFLRGGPYGSIGEFCAECHTVDQLGRYNPHQAMVDRPDSEAVCEFCHESAEVTTADMDDLKVASPLMCSGCHRDKDVHAGSEEHMVELEADMVEKAEAAGLPLDETTVYCGTCHDTHPAGSIEENEDRVAILGQDILPEGWMRSVLAPVLEERGQALGVEVSVGAKEPDYLRLPLAGAELCLACHDRASIDLARREDTP